MLFKNLNYINPHSNICSLPKYVIYEYKLILSADFETKKNANFSFFQIVWNKTLITKSIYLQIVKTGKYFF